MKNLLLKTANVLFMIMFWISFSTFCYPFVTEMFGESACNIFGIGLLGSILFISLWAVSLNCWMKDTIK